jgi:hypothetical protein
VRKHLVGQISHQLGHRGLVRAPGIDSSGERRHPDPNVLNQASVVGEHRFKGLGLGVRHRISVLALPS